MSKVSAIFSRVRRVVPWLWLGVPLVGIGELGAQLWCERRAPRTDDYALLRAPLASIKRSGDVVVVSPRWAEPLVRRAVGDTIMPIEDVARADMSRFDRAIEVSVLGQHSPELEGFREVATQDVGPFVVRALENPHHSEVVYDFVENLRPPIASVLGTDPPLECNYSTRAEVISGGLGGHPTFPKERFLCPGSEFFNVGVTVIADEKFLPRRCIWSHPFRTGELVTRFEGIELGDVITGHGGMYWVTERALAGAPVKLDVVVDGDVVGSYTHRDGDGWSGFRFELGTHARAATATVEFKVSSSDYQHRHFCFEATSR